MSTYTLYHNSIDLGALEGPSYPPKTIFLTLMANNYLMVQGRHIYILPDTLTANHIWSFI